MLALSTALRHIRLGRQFESFSSSQQPWCCLQHTCRTAGLGVVVEKPEDTRCWAGPQKLSEAVKALWRPLLNTGTSPPCVCYASMPLPQAFCPWHTGHAQGSQNAISRASGAMQDPEAAGLQALPAPVCLLRRARHL